MHNLRLNAYRVFANEGEAAKTAVPRPIQLSFAFGEEHATSNSFEEITLIICSGEHYQRRFPVLRYMNCEVFNWFEWIWVNWTSQYIQTLFGNKMLLYFYRCCLRGSVQARAPVNPMCAHPISRKYLSHYKFVVGLVLLLMLWLLLLLLFCWRWVGWGWSKRQLEWIQITGNTRGPIERIENRRKCQPF